MGTSKFLQIDREKINKYQAHVMNQHKQAIADVSRPIYHAICPANWMNDPNGPILYKGEVHVFYQHNPIGIGFGEMCWGHMKSKDLVHWSQEPIALVPSNDRGETGCWSGSCVFGPDEVPTIIYTSVGPQRDPKTKSEQWIATSHDGLVTWEKPPENPVITQLIHGTTKVEDWRDPFVWRNSKGSYYCVCGGHIIQNGVHPQNPSMFLYKSSDLQHWTFLGPMTSRWINGTEVSIEPMLNLGTNWECPLFFPIGNKYCAIASTNWVPYNIGDFIDEKFTPSVWHGTDYGNAFYAPHTFTDQQGRRILIGWLQSQIPTIFWRGCFTIPRVLTLQPDNTLFFDPIPEIAELHESYITSKNITLPPNSKWELISLTGTANPYYQNNPKDGLKTVPIAVHGAFELNLSIAIERSVPIFELEFFNDPKMSFFNTLSYEPEENLFFIGRAAGPFTLKPEEKSLNMRIFFDRSVMEIYINRRFCLTYAFPSAQNCNQGPSVVLRTNETSISVIAYDLWTMRSINM